MAHANRAYLVRRKARWVQIPEGATQVPGPTQVPGNPTAPPEKENRPEGRLEKWRPCWGAEMGRDVPQRASKASVPRANEKGRRLCRPRSSGQRFGLAHASPRLTVCLGAL